MTSVRVEGHDHVVVTVADVERSLTWYRDLLAGERTGQNIDHVALRVADDTDLDAVASSGDFDVVRGPIWVWGAKCDGWSLYVRDPDGNVIELKRYGGEPPQR